MGFNLVHKLLAITALGTEWVLWLLIALSIVSIGIMIERFLFFKASRIDFAAFMQELNQLLQKSDYEGVKALCEKSGAIESQVVLRGMEYREKGSKAMEESMSSYLIGNRQILDRGLVVLGTLGNNAPFIGLFGTVLGIILAFQGLAVNPAGGPSVVMAGISEALIATAVGLLVAIPAVISFNAFQRVVKRHMSNAEAVVRIVLLHASK